MRGFMSKTGAGAGLVGLIATTGLAAPAQASPVDSSVLSDLAGAGIPVADPAATAALGQSVCPMLTEPAGTAAAVAAPVTGLGGGPSMSPQMAQLFTTIAIQTYCPEEIASIANGNLTGGLPQVPGMPGLPALPGA